MADYYTNFSCVLDVQTPENAQRAQEIYAGDLQSGDEVPYTSGFALQVDTLRPTVLWMFSDDTGDVEALIDFVSVCAREFNLSGRWGFEYANTCSKRRLDAFGGGAHVIDLGTGETIGWTSTSEWLAASLRPNPTE